MTYECFFDGSCEPQNPNGNMGYGVYIKSDNSEYSDAKFIPAKLGNTNNIAEYLGILLILNLMVNKKDSHIKIFGDSKMVVNQMNGSFAIKEGNYVPYANKAKELLAKVKENNTVEITWIPREENSIADELSKSYVVGKYPIVNVIKTNVVGKEVVEPKVVVNDDYEVSVITSFSLSSNLFTSKPTKNEVINKLLTLSKDELGAILFKNIDSSLVEINDFRKVVTNVVEPVIVKPVEATNQSEENSVLWNIFKTILQKAIQNRDEFTEIYTETKFSELELNRISAMGMVDLYYDDAAKKYVLTIKWQ